MILIFGGTTEGKKALKICDEAGKLFYYSTKTLISGEGILHGVSLSGDMDKNAILNFCKEKEIRLLIDAAHPFASVLHENIAHVSEQLNIPVIRYERKYSKEYQGLIWFDNYVDATDYLLRHHVDHLLALTGVNTIRYFKRYWEKYNCWFRILDREESRREVAEQGFPLEKIIYYQSDGYSDTSEFALFESLHPQAIITKESGESGGFSVKLAAARKLNIPVLVIRRPVLSDKFMLVYGENGLRKKLEELCPDFFPLKTGYTTGLCATAAAKSALKSLLTGKLFSEIDVTLVNGESVSLLVNKTITTEDVAESTVIKDAGDDPDVTNGVEIIASVRLNTTHSSIRFLQGKGVGVVTLPGLGLNIGEPAINQTPRRMITSEFEEILRDYQYCLPNHNSTCGVDVTISVPNGEVMAQKTFNPKLGIMGGISIIGTSGIVRPFSSEAFVASIVKEMQVAKALGCTHVIVNSGAKSERHIKAIYPNFPDQAFIHYGNFIGEALKAADHLDFQELSLGVMIGKAVKLAEGALDTHSKKVVMNKEFLVNLAKKAGCTLETQHLVQNITVARELWNVIPQDKFHFFTMLLSLCDDVCQPLFSGKLHVFLITEDGHVVCR